MGYCIVKLLLPAGAEFQGLRDSHLACRIGVGVGEEVELEALEDLQVVWYQLSFVRPLPFANGFWWHRYFCIHWFARVA